MFEDVVTNENVYAAVLQRDRTDAGVEKAQSGILMESRGSSNGAVVDIDTDHTFGALV
jgi:hypothetical protein